MKDAKGGKRDGLTTWWHENAQKGMEATYKNGQRHGLATWWDEYGQKERDAIYRNGAKVE